jgi:hypothetical protein
MRQKLWVSAGRRALENLVLEPWTRRRRDELLQMLNQLDRSAQELDRAAEEKAKKCADVV